MDWLMAQSSGVFLLRLVRKGSRRETIDHTVAIDAAKKLIYDPVEPFALKFRHGALTVCLGDGVQLEEIAEIRQIFRQSVSNRGTSKRRKTTEQRKRLRENKRAKAKEQKSSNSTNNVPCGSSSSYWFTSS